MMTILQIDDVKSLDKAILRAYPAAAKVKDEDEWGMLPLHWASAFCKAGRAAVRRLIESYPEG